MIRVGEHLEVLTSPGGRRHTGGIVVGCVVDSSNGELSYYINSKEISVKHKVGKKKLLLSNSGGYQANLTFTTNLSFISDGMLFPIFED